MRPHFQRGSLYIEGKNDPKWIGRFRVRKWNQKTKRRSVILGRVSEMPKSEAQRMLIDLISREDEQHRILHAAKTTGKVPVGFQPSRNGQVGYVAELLVAADLLSKGFDVFRAVNPNAACDLVACRSGALSRIEVKYIADPKPVNVRRAIQHNLAKFDTLAVVDSNGQIVYSTVSDLLGTERGPSKSETVEQQAA